MPSMVASTMVAGMRPEHAKTHEGPRVKKASWKAYIHQFFFIHDLLFKYSNTLIYIYIYTHVCYIHTYV